MKIYVCVKQKHLYTDERHTLYEGAADWQQTGDVMTLAYREAQGDGEVCLCASPTWLQLQRKSCELTSRLLLEKGRCTEGAVLSEFGRMDIQLYTHKYIRKEHHIAVSYDVLSGDQVSDGFLIIWKWKEEPLS